MSSRLIGFICSWMILIGLASLVDARPYSVVARYGSGGGSDLSKLTLLPDAEIPDKADDKSLRDIAIAFEPRPFGLFPSQAFESFHVEVKVDGKTCTKTSLVLSELENGGVFRACSWSPGQAQDRDPIRVTVEVRAKLSRDMLCAVEALHREKNGEARHPAAARDLYVERAPGYRLRFGRAQELFASYCHQTLWEEVAELPAYSRSGILPAKIEMQERETLFEMIRPSISSLFAKWAEFDSDEPASIVEKLEFDVFRTQNAFIPFEYGPEGAVEASTVVDAESTISFTITDKAKMCPNFRRAPFRYTLSVPGNTDAVVTITPKYRSACQFDLPVDLKKHLNKKLVIRALYDIDNGESLTLYELEFKSHTLGFDWTFPVVSELVAASQGWSKDEFRAQSSLPLSWAIGLKKNPQSGVALTIPWKISYATRRTPNLPDMFSIYPHISLIVMDDDEGNDLITYSAGVGLGLLNSFYFSYGAAFAGSHRGDHFLMIGLDIKDLAGVYKP